MVDEWLRQLQRVLGGSGGTPPGAHTPADAPAVSGEPIPYASSTYQVTAVDQFIQVIPAGYYDTLTIAWVYMGIEGDGKVFGQERPLLVIPERIAARDGVHLTTTYAPSNSEFLRDYPPFRAVPFPERNVGSGEARIDLPLTNMPVAIVPFDILDAQEDRDMVFRVTLTTERH